ncbi:DUF7146 domain-containing protein [Novosphingobium sp. RL4]|uniref:DUF7146 domain-containing protein n=1 Tax=Novosphingobium sp. RL4 TaxID=3109595 RepID=UPI002D77AEB0|nr:toprim domain-containing protein [Novosphingobium sp. RL4]WRT91349.1 toprim domain-containing protein [Novosphingobium sp. RL4]
MTVYSVSEIADKINGLARELAPDLLPNGQYNHNRTRWHFSGIADTGKSHSAYVELAGTKQGKWFDYGNAAAGEDKGDMLDLLRLKLGLADARAAVEEAKIRLGIVDDWKPGKPALLPPEERTRRAREAQERAERREDEAAAERAKAAKRAKSLYLGGVRIAGTGAEEYLKGRSLFCEEWPGVLRFRDKVWYQDEHRKMEVPAMLAAVYLASGEQVATHRTYLHRNSEMAWIKLQVPKPKKVLGKMWGGFIPISKGSSGKSMRDMPAGEPVYVTEGIEDALVVRMMMPDARIISAISLGNIGAIRLPAAARRLVIVADRDSKLKAQEQLERSIAQQQARGLEVRMVMPPEEHDGEAVKDMNDWLVAWLKSRARQRKGAA